MPQHVVFPPRGEARAQARHGRPVSRGRARHAARRGDGFGRLLAWTTAGAALPGLSLLVAGRRRLGVALLALVALGVAGIVGLAVTGHLLDLGLKLAVRPTALLVLAGALLVLGLAWACVIVAGHVALRRRPWLRTRLSTGQQLLAGLLVAALVAAVVLPTATAARYAMTQRSLVLTVFDDEGEVERDPDLAVPDTASRDPWAGTPRLNVLLLGSDAGVDRQGTRPDTIIVASIDTQDGDTVLFSLPRNLERAPFPAGSPGAEEFPDGFYCAGHTECLLNGVWTWAENNADLFPDVDQPGLTTTRQVVGETLGLSIDYYAIVDLSGFEEVVDALGGLRIDVERRIPIGGGINQATGRSYPITGYIEPGPQLLDGYRALWYARSREGSTDYDRIRRQRCVIAAAVDQAEPRNLARAFPRLAASAEKNVETDITGSELDAFVELGLRVQAGELRSLPFTDEVITSADPDLELIRQLVADAIDPPPPPPGPSEPAPAEPEPGETAPADPGQEPAVDPAAAQDVDEVCGT